MAKNCGSAIGKQQKLKRTLELSPGLSNPRPREAPARKVAKVSLLKEVADTPCKALGQAEAVRA